MCIKFKANYHFLYRIFGICIFFETVHAGLKDREFILEKLEQCQPKLSSYVMLFDIKRALMINNTLTVNGFADVSEALGKSMALTWRFRRCPMGIKDCSSEFDFPIPSFCLLMGAKTPFGDGLGKFVTPKFACPVKKGHYRMNLTIPLQSIIDIPSSRVRYRVKLFFLDARKKRSVGCVEIVSWKDREFVLEKLEQCQPKLSSYLILFDVKRALMINNTLTVNGFADVSEPLGKTMALTWRFRRCPMGIKDCSSEFDFPIPSFCLLMGAKTPFGDGLGKFVTPKFTCPVKKGHYRMNLTIPLQSIIDIPSSRVRYRVKLFFLDARKKRSVGCVELVSYVRQINGN